MTDLPIEERLLNQRSRTVKVGIVARLDGLDTITNRTVRPIRDALDDLAERCTAISEAAGDASEQLGIWIDNDPSNVEDREGRRVARSERSEAAGQALGICEELLGLLLSLKDQI